MKNPLRKIAMGMGNVGDDETERLLRMVQTRADNKALLKTLFAGSDEASREKARAAAEKLFVQTPAAVTMRPNMQTKEAAEQPEKKPASKPAAKKSEPPHPLKTVEKVHKHTLDAVKQVTHPGLSDKKSDHKPVAKTSEPTQKQASILAGDLELFVELDRRDIARNTVECFEKKAHLSTAHRLYPELLKVASSVSQDDSKKDKPSKLKHYAKYIGTGGALGAGLGATAAYIHGKNALHGAGIGAGLGGLVGAGYATDPKMTGAVVRHVAPHVINHSMKTYRQNKQHEHEKEMADRRDKENHRPRGKCLYCGASAPSSGNKCSYCGHHEFSKSAASAALVGSGRPLVNMAKRPGIAAATGATPSQSVLSR